MQKLIDDNAGNLDSPSVRAAAKSIEDRLRSFKPTFDDITITRDEIDFARDRWLGSN